MRALAISVWRSSQWIVPVDRAWTASALILLLVAVVAPGQAEQSVRFVLASLWSTAPFLILSVAAAAYASASGASNLIARVFTGRTVVMVLAAAAFGGLSPFCSCGVIPIIAALLSMGVPLAPVMAFWLSSPVIDPSMFVLTAGLLGPGFAVAKTITAVALGLIGGYATMALIKAGAFASPLRDGIGDGGCAASSVRSAKPVAWAFWHDEERVGRFGREGAKSVNFLAKWLTLAFLLESLMLAYVPADLIASSVGGEGVMPILIATFVGVPAYLNGYAALPLVSGLIEQGMAQGAALAFLVAGGVTSIPAAIAVFALVKKPVFLLYLALALGGSLAAGLFFEFWLGLAA